MGWGWRKFGCGSGRPERERVGDGGGRVKMVPVRWGKRGKVWQWGGWGGGEKRGMAVAGGDQRGSEEAVAGGQQHGGGRVKVGGERERVGAEWTGGGKEREGGNGLG